MQHIENIIFDLGGIILNIDIKRTQDAFTALGVKDISHYFGHGFAASFFREHEKGLISDETFIRNIKDLIRLDLTDEVIINAWNALLLDFPPERIALLKELSKKYRLFLFSNTNSLHYNRFHAIYNETFGHPGFDAHFEKAYYSHILKLRKPDTASFEAIIQENSLRKDLTLFVDDALINVQGAESAGLKGFYLPAGISITDIKW